MDKKNSSQPKPRVRQRYSANLTPQCLKKQGNYKPLAIPPISTTRKPTANVVKVSQYVTDRNKLSRKESAINNNTKHNGKTIHIQLFDADQIINGSKPKEEYKNESNVDKLGLNYSIERDNDISEMNRELPLANTVRTTTATIIPVFKCKPKPSSLGLSSLTQQHSVISIASLSSFDISETPRVFSPSPLQSDE